MFRIIAAILVFTLVVSCKDKKTEKKVSENELIKDSIVKKNTSFQNRWVLKKIDDSTFTDEYMLNHPFVPRFRVDTTDNYFYGKLACNGFSAEYTREGNKISIKDYFKNEISCTSISMEEKFEKQLWAIDSLKIENDKLSFYTDDKKLEFVNFPEQPIENGKWELYKVNDTIFEKLESNNMVKSIPSLKFNLFNREVTVNVGCGNEFPRDLIVSENTLNIQPLSIFPRPKECDKNWSIPFLDEISGEVNYSIENDLLRIENKNGKQYIFRRQLRDSI